MRLEYVPVVFGVLVLLIAGGIIYDAATAKQMRPYRERRRRTRAILDRPGEFIVGFGTICLGAALMAPEDWRWTTITVLAGVVLIVIGAILNRVYLREMLLFRGASRRTPGGKGPPNQPKENEPRLRIR
jgi:cell division protein FtsW (lipid II flippase)